MKTTLITLLSLISLSSFAGINCKSDGVVDVLFQGKKGLKMKAGVLRANDKEIYLSYNTAKYGSTIGYDKVAADGIYYKVQRGYCSMISCMSPKTINGYSVLIVDDLFNNIIVSEVFIPSKGKKLSNKAIVQAVESENYKPQVEIEFYNCN